jgi:hypothetical protein
MKNRHEEGKQMPRVIWPNDIMPDENQFSEMSREAQVNVMRNVDGRIGKDENR